MKKAFIFGLQGYTVLYSGEVIVERACITLGVWEQGILNAYALLTVSFSLTLTLTHQQLSETVPPTIKE